MPSAPFCHDMAFFLQPGLTTPHRRIGYHIRTDVESSGELPILRENYDVSAAGTELDAPDRLFDEVESLRSSLLIVCTSVSRPHLSAGRFTYFAEIISKSKRSTSRLLSPIFNVTLLHPGSSCLHTRNHDCSLDFFGDGARSAEATPRR